ncbi:MAG TPA: TetR/AcrR family transcriptional regulator [Propionibacteriaceae bacterium]
MSQNTEFPAKRRQGRPRDASVQSKVLAATLRLLARDGYEGMSVDGVAEAAGVTKPTIYRRWASKEDLAVSAVGSLSAEPAPEIASDDVWDSLRAEMAAYARAVGRPQSMNLIGTVLVEEIKRPQMIAKFREKVVQPRRHRIRAVLHRGQLEGSIRPDVDIDVCVNLLIGYYYAGYLGDQLASDWPNHCVRILREGVATPAEGHGDPTTDSGAIA